MKLDVISEKLACVYRKLANDLSIKVSSTFNTSEVTSSLPMLALVAESSPYSLMLLVGLSRVLRDPNI